MLCRAVCCVSCGLRERDERDKRWVAQALSCARQVAAADRYAFLLLGRGEADGGCAGGRRALGGGEGGEGQGQEGAVELHFDGVCGGGV